MITEQEGYSIYKEGLNTVFEFKEQRDWAIYFESFKKNNPRSLKYQENTMKCLEAYQQYRNTGFVVRYEKFSVQPKRFDYFGI